MQPRKVSNDVGAAVSGPQAILEPGLTIPVAVRVWWDDETDPETVEGWCLGWTREHVHVEITDRLTAYKYRSWVSAMHVSRLLL